MLFDTHAHYYSGAFRHDREELLSSLPDKGVGLVLCPGSDLHTSRICIDIAERYPYIYAAAGVHPQDAAATLPRWADELRPLLDHPKVRAVGEIGLDYYYDDNAPHPVQQAVFRTQMELAEEKNLPVIVHDRDAHQDCLKLVRDYPKVPGVFHCYSGSLEEAKVLVKFGYLLSFTGTITFKNARKAPEVISWLPLEHIMVETDAPYMAPTPFRGKRCDSTMVYRMAETIAQIKGLPLEEVIRATTENGKRLFRID
ncbi:MAG: hydrolase TatD [Firmicutes bacterium]|nr:hydrolase TatD [Bacillota bacterium]